MKDLIVIIFIGLILSSCGGIHLPEGSPFIGEGVKEEEVVEITPSEKMAVPVRPEKIEKQKNIIRKYGVYWLGINIADFYADIEQKGNDYKFKSYIETHGIAKLVSGFRSNTESIFNKSGDKFIPKKFNTNFVRRGKIRDIELVYSKDGKKITHHKNEPAEHPGKRPPVPEDVRNGSIDPMTFIFTVRERLKTAIQKGEKKFSSRFYDGRRLTELEFKIKGKTKTGLINISFIENPISGYTKNELSDIDDRKVEISLYISPNDFLPVKAFGDSTFGKATAILEKECKTIEECRGD